MFCSFDLLPNCHHLKLWWSPNRLRGQILTSFEISNLDNNDNRVHVYVAFNSHLGSLRDQWILLAASEAKSWVKLTAGADSPGHLAGDPLGKHWWKLYRGHVGGESRWSLGHNLCLLEVFSCIPGIKMYPIRFHLLTDYEEDIGMRWEVEPNWGWSEICRHLFNPLLLMYSWSPRARLEPFNSFVLHPEDFPKYILFCISSHRDRLKGW